MSDEVAKWYEEKALQLGVSQSNLMVIALSEYMKQDISLGFMSNLKETMEYLESKKEGENNPCK